MLRPVYKQTERADGFVSLEVSPYIARDTAATIAEARRLWKEVNRENVMIKVPATEEGIPAIRTLLGEGININITLLFSRSAYRQVAEAYLDGLELYIAAGGHPDRLSSVASFFVSRIDSAGGQIDRRTSEKAPSWWRDGGACRFARENRHREREACLPGLQADLRRPALAQAERCGRPCAAPALGQHQHQEPGLSRCRLCRGADRADTVNTMPPETLAASRDHGAIRPSLEENVAAAENMMATLSHFGISLDDITTKLTSEAVKLFADAFDDLLAAVEKKRAASLGAALNRQSASLAPDAEQAVKDTLDEWRRSGNVRRLWRRDATLWTGADEAKWLGWLDIAVAELEDIDRFQEFASDVRKAKFTHAVLLGMGGSSLGAEVFARTFGAQTGYPKLLVLDSTDPVQIKNIEDAIDLRSTLFIVSSKSGTTLEPNILKDYFFTRAQAVLDEGKAASHFIAITDPGSKLAGLAATEHFRKICVGKPDIGGRYSVLSDFGLVPAAAMGVDAETLLTSTLKMVRSCGADVPPSANPGVTLGIILGVMAAKGRDKLTIIASPGISDIGAWLEQLIAESTGKQGKGIIPVDGEPLASPEFYGKDRLFAYLRLDGDSNAALDDGVLKLEQAGQPVVRIAVPNRAQIGQEFFRWEIATAVAGAILRINPFDQPDVEASKIKTRGLMEVVEARGSLPPEVPLFEETGIKIFADENNGKILKQAGDGASLVGSLKAHLARAHDGDYCALLAYVAQDEANREALQDIRTAIRDRKKVATCVGFGPRFLHSTGQAYKGGPNTGIFLQITADHRLDIPVPGRKYSFGAVIDATARGDFEVLNERGRRAIRVHLGADVAAGLARLKQAVVQALA